MIELYGSQCQIAIWNHRKPLTDRSADIPLIRMEAPGGWFVGEVRKTGREGLGFAAVKVQADNEFHPGLVEITRRYVQMPLWFVVLATGLASAWSFAKIGLRRVYPWGS